MRGGGNEFGLLTFFFEVLGDVTEGNNAIATDNDSKTVTYTLENKYRYYNK